MIFFDSHVHSAASPDSEMAPEAAIVAIRKQGLGVAFTEHVDFSEHSPKQNAHSASMLPTSEIAEQSPKLKKDPNATDATRGVGDFVCDFSVYPQEYRKWRCEDVTLGLEIGLSHAFANANAELAAGDFDFILGSVHTVDGIELYHAANKLVPSYENEPFAQAMHNPREIDSCIAQYFEYARELVEKCGFFDSFGHIDYIVRYGAIGAAEFSYEKFSREIDDLLRSIAQRGISLEINTSRFVQDTASKKAAFDPRNAIEDMQKILKRFAALGGQHCTIGSDAHSVSQLGRGFAAAREIAAEAGLAIVHYKERRPIICG